MGNIKKEQIRRKFYDDSEEAQMETFCIYAATTHTDEILDKYKRLAESRDGQYINSDLMKMTFDFYKNDLQNRRRFNLSITNSAAVLTNELYTRSIKSEDVKKCIFVLGPYGAGKSFFVQSLFESNLDIMENCIVYEGSITPPAFDEKVQLAIDNGVTPYLIALNPTLELSIRNIKERAKRIGRDVEKGEVVDKFSNFYRYITQLVAKFEGINYLIYSKDKNEPINFESGSKDLEELNHGSAEEIDRQYDEILDKLKCENMDYSKSLNNFLEIE